MSQPPPSEARLRADARKAKIQARGAERLAKLTNTARGEEGAKLYDDVAPAARPKPTSNESSTSLTSIPHPSDAPSSSPFGPGGGLDDLFPPGAGGAGADPFAAMLQAMQAGGGPGGGGFPSSPFGDVPGGGGGGDDPFAPMLNSMTAGGPGGGLPPGFGQQQQQQPDFAYSGEKTKRDKVFDLAHVLGVVGLVSLVLRWWEPMALAKRSMGGCSPNEDGGMACVGASPLELPVFWAFVTISLILQTSRALLFRSRPPPSKLLSLASPFLPLLPPNLKSYLFTASRYLSVVTQFGQDLCLLVFLLGVSRWWNGWGVYRDNMFPLH